VLSISPIKQISVLALLEGVVVKKSVFGHVSKPSLGISETWICVVKKSISAWLESAMVIKVNFSMSGKDHSRKSQFKHGWTGVKARKLT
jgi:hypothetical protein